MAQSVPSHDEIRAALNRVLASRQFSHAGQQSQFLRFVVEEAIQGRATDLKEYSIGAALKGPSFNGDEDTTVRVQAGKIRKKLADYYAGVGHDDPLIIEIPKPGYLPVFRYRRLEQPAARPLRHRLAPMLAGTTPLLAIALTILIRSGGSPGIPRPPLRLIQITRDGGMTAEPAISRDGRLLAFSSDRGEPGNIDIWIRDLEGGEPRRLTHHPATDSTPDISPDSQTLVFRSDRDGGGIYVMPVAGGKERRIADGGYSPRFSPNGRWIAYARFDPSGNASIYVVPAQGGPPRRIQSQDLPSSCPLWTPDGNAIQFAVDDRGLQDWWLARFDPSADHALPASDSGLIAAMRRQGLDPVDYACNRDWLDNDLVLSSKRGLLRVRMSPGSSAVRGITQVLPQLDVDGVRVVKPAFGKMSVVYERHYDQTHIWGIPLDGELVESKGEMRQLADEMTVRGLYGARPSLSSDGRFLVFSNGLDPSTYVWLCDLKKGAKTLLNPAGSFADRPVISRDGETIAWRERTGSKEAINAVRTADPTRRRQICTDCGEPRDWSPDRNCLLYVRDGSLGLLDVNTGLTMTLLPRDRYEVFHASFSPDARRIALVIRIPGKDKVQGVVAPFIGGVGAESTWVRIAEETYELSMEWAPEGDALYYFNRRDGSRCLWEQRLDRSGFRPLGEPIAVRHFDNQRRYPTQGSWIAPAKGLVGVNLNEHFSNLYRLYLP